MAVVKNTQWRTHDQTMTVLPRYQQEDEREIRRYHLKGRRGTKGDPKEGNTGAGTEQIQDNQMRPTSTATEKSLPRK